MDFSTFTGIPRNMVLTEQPSKLDMIFWEALYKVQKRSLLFDNLCRKFHLLTKVWTQVPIPGHSRLCGSPDQRLSLDEKDLSLLVSTYKPIFSSMTFWGHCYKKFTAVSYEFS
jgi:hypothetical protein